MTLTFILILAIVFRVLSNPMANIFQKQITLQGQHPLFVNLVSYLLLSIISVFIIVAYPLPELDAQFWIFSVLGGIAGALGNGYIIKALETGDLSVLGPVNAYKSVVGAAAAFLLIGEIPSAWGFLGMAMIIFGSYFVLDTTPEKFSWALLKNKAIQYRLAALLFTGIQAVFDKVIIQHSDLKLAFASWSIFGAVFSLLLFSFADSHFRTEINKLNKDLLVKYLGLTICVGLMVAATNISFSLMPVGEALALFQLSGILTIFLGHRYFQEKDLKQKLLGTVIMIAGSALIILYK